MQQPQEYRSGPAHLAVVGELEDVADRWELGALCRGAHGSLFFGPHGFESKRDRTAREERAKEICARCPALVACRDHALRHGELYGVWGGLGETERRLMLERQGRIARAG